MPFLPNATGLVEEFLDELILDSPEKAFERSTRPRGTERYYKDKFSGKNVLIGSLRARDQLAVCLSERIYYMPLRNLARQSLLTQFEYVGIYQSRTLFKEAASGVHWVGIVRDWQVVRRREIQVRPPRPGTEDELYVVFHIQEWKRLAEPVKPGGSSIYTHLFTTRYKFY